MKKNLLMRFRSIRTSIIAAFSVLIVFALLTYLLISLQYTENTVLKNSKEYTCAADRPGKQRHRFLHQLYGKYFLYRIQQL